MNIQNSKIVIKRSTTGGVVPTIPASDDHTDGSWLTTDIYKGEFFINLVDGILYTRDDNGIKTIPNLSDTTYGPTWNANLDGATKNTLYDKIETLLPLDGSKPMTGDLDLDLNDIIDALKIKYLGVDAINISTRRLVDSAGTATLDWENTLYGDDLGVISMNWGTRGLYKSTGTLSIDYEDCRLWDLSDKLSIDWNVRGLVNIAGDTYIVEWDTSDAVLELTSTTKPFLPPRMTTTQKNAISGPLAGAMVFDTTLNKLCVYGASAWETITSV